MLHKNKNQYLRIASYIRVSTEEQAASPEGSIKNQEERIKEAVAYRNRDNTYGEIVQTFIDPGISAKDMKRPALQALLRAIRAGEVDLVIVTELSRLSRNIRDFIEIWDLMRSAGCLFSSIREDFVSNTAAGELLLFLVANFSQFERKQISERVEANMAARAKRGLYNGGTIPVGYKSAIDRPGYLEVDDEMAEVVRTAFGAFLREGSLSPTAKWLNENGYVLRKNLEGGGKYKRHGHFTTDNLHAVLRQKAYIGVKSFTHRGESFETKAVWPAIIDEVTFRRVGKLLSENKQRLKPHKPNKLPYILSGITVCAKCQNPMVGKSATGRSGKVGYYEHSWATKRDSSLTKKIFKCDPHRVPSKKLEPLVWEKFLSFINDQNFVRDVLKKVREFHEANPTRKEQERLRSKIFGLNSQLDALAERLSEIPKGVSAAPIFKQMQKLEDLKSQHEGELENLKDSGAAASNRVVELLEFEAFAKRYRALTFKELSVDQKKQLLRRFIQKIEVGVDSVKIHFIVDREHFEREAALSGTSATRDSSILNFKGSNTLTNGAREWT